MIRRRLAVRFAVQMAIAGAVLVIIAVLVVLWMFERLEDIEIRRNFAPAGISRLISEADIDAQGLIVDAALLQRLQEDGGWLQSLDQQGRVLQSFNAPSDLPARYVPGQLMDYWLGDEPFPYTLGLWIQEKEGIVYTLLYGTRSRTKDLLQRVIDDGQIQGHQIRFSGSTITQLKQTAGWVQVLDRTGRETASWSKPGDAPSLYTLQDLALQSVNQTPSGFLIDSQYDKRSGLTWVLQYPAAQSTVRVSRYPVLESEVQVMIIGIAAFLLAALVVFILLSLWYANRFGAPVLYILGWIQKLGKGDYSRQEGVTSRRRNLRDRWKRGYRVFGEVMDSIDSLAAKLRAAKDAEEQTQRYREEWIAGVTHDMKTPLASIQGYAHMLEADKYSWSEEEVRRFASTILEKTAYMNNLINDLALTYRLRNGAIPVPVEETDIAALLSGSVARTQEHPAFEDSRISCLLPSTPITAALYPPWFNRVVDNIVANSLLHNALGTRIEIELTELQGNGFRIEFKDNGQGMDDQTLAALFDRYYRGTNTDSSTEGSGLGMAVTKELVQAMGGQIEVESQRGQGTVIRLIFF